MLFYSIRYRVVFEYMYKTYRINLRRLITHTLIRSNIKLPMYICFAHTEYNIFLLQRINVLPKPIIINSQTVQKEHGLKLIRTQKRVKNQ